MNSDNKKLYILNVYADFIKNGNMFPTRADLNKMHVNRDMIRYYYGNIKNLRNAVKEIYPELFNGLFDETYLGSNTYLSKFNKELKKFNTYIITTAINGQKAHSKFVETLKKLSKIYNAKIIMLPSYDRFQSPSQTIEWHFDDILSEHSFLFGQISLNKNIHISPLRINAKQINPTTGLSRICQGKGSFIFSSPKQSLEYDPVSNVKYPHARMSTGACTIPNYNNKNKYMRTPYMAQNDHILGALIIEIEDEEIYHFRQIQADKNGGVCDLGKYYFGSNKPKNMIPKLIMGDYHAGEHDETAIKAWEEIIDELHVDQVFFHDLFNGKSINHHEENNIIIRARNSQKGLLNLQDELYVTGKELNRINNHKSIKKSIIVKSNHDEFLQKWLEYGKFKDDPINFQSGCVLANLAINDCNILEQALLIYGNLKNKEKLIFLNRDEDYKIGGIELGAHGDKGSNGARGSKSNIENAYGKAVIGHSHTPGILRGVYQVGTSSLFRLGYNQGASSWMHCSCLLYENGQRQLINSINGKWRLKRNK